MDPITTMGMINTVSQMANNDPARQQQYTLDLMQHQYDYNEQAANNQMARELQMFNATGYGARVQQLKTAGLNPGLIYAMGAGAGGGVTGNITAAQVGQGTAPNVPADTSNKIAAEGMMLQLAKMQSEIKVNESVAAVNEAAANLKSGPETELTKSQTIGQDIQNTFNQINTEVAQSTKDVNIQKIVTLADQAKVEMNRSIQGLIQDKTKSAEDVATLQSKIDQYNANVQKTVAETINKNVDSEEKRQAITESIARISQNWMQKTIDVQQLEVELKKTLMNNNTTIDATVISSLSHILSGMMPKF